MGRKRLKVRARVRELSQFYNYRGGQRSPGGFPTGQRIPSHCIIDIASLAIVS